MSKNKRASSLQTDLPDLVHLAKVDPVLARRQQLVGVLGILCGALIALVFGYWSYRLLDAGHTVGGCILGTGDLTALVALFVTTSRRRQ